MLAFGYTYFGIGHTHIQVLESFVGGVRWVLLHSEVMTDSRAYYLILYASCQKLWEILFHNSQRNKQTELEFLNTSSGEKNNVL